uniref:Putative adenosine receptor n=1 Tax=Platynereis dumerilii TaxID=6359 RepID=Q2WBW3_PLADU|nr:putative adenosine receptor [Platynereis dumerilii]
MSWAYYLSFVGEVIIATMSVVGNGLVILLIIKDEQLQTTTNYLVASLATADLLVGAMGIPAVLAAINGYPHNFYGCLFVNSLIVLLTQISIFGLMVLAIERFVAIKNPFSYHQHCNGKVVTAVVASYWIAGIIVGLVPMFGWNLGPGGVECAFVEVIDMKYMVYFNFFGFVLVPLILMLVIYIYIYRVVIKQMRQIASLQVHDSNTSSGFNKHSLKKEIKAAKWFAVVILLFAVSWIPIHIMNAVTLFAGKTCIICVNIAVLLSHLSSAVNPMLYALSNKKFKSAWRKLRGQRVESDFESSLKDNSEVPAVINPAA